MGFISVCTCDRPDHITIAELARRAGGIQTYILLYEQLNAKAYPDHKECDFALRVEETAGVPVLILYSQKLQSSLGWIVCPKEFRTYFSKC